MQPVTHLLHGFIGSGKTTFARRLERETGAKRFSHDEIMIRIHGWNPPEEHFGKYRVQVENLIWEEAQREVGAGNDVILDIGFWTRESRIEARHRAGSIGASARFYRICCPQQIMRARALKRSKSPCIDSLWIDGPGFDKLFTTFEPMQDDEEHVPIDGQNATLDTYR